nr:MAG: hypothetical protein DIU57_14940 [Pseudomonadota bacterium]
MFMPLEPASATRLALFAPPYDQFLPLDLDWRCDDLPPRGLAIIWWLVDGHEQQDQFGWLADRPYGVPLFIILPPATELGRAMPLLRFVNALYPRAVLPTGSIVAPRYIKQILSLPPSNFPRTVGAYLEHRGLLKTPEIRKEVEQIFRLVPSVCSISALARRMCTSRRTLGRHFAAAGLPVPSHWLQFARLLYASIHLQAERATVFRIAARVGYPDGFTMSNQMKRLLGCRPTEVRECLGWEWVVESWIRHEVAAGGIDRVRFESAVRVYLTGPDLSPE